MPLSRYLFSTGYRSGSCAFGSCFVSRNVFIKVSSCVFSFHRIDTARSEVEGTRGTKLVVPGKQFGAAPVSREKKTGSLPLPRLSVLRAHVDAARRGAASHR